VPLWNQEKNTIIATAENTSISEIGKIKFVLVGAWPTNAAVRGQLPWYYYQKEQKVRCVLVNSQVRKWALFFDYQFKSLFLCRF